MYLDAFLDFLQILFFLNKRCIESVACSSKSQSFSYCVNHTVNSTNIRRKKKKLKITVCL